MDKVEVAEVLLALAGELDGLHQWDLIVACGILGLHKGVVVGEVDLAMEEVSGRWEGLRNVGEHVSHALNDPSPIRAV